MNKIFLMNSTFEESFEKHGSATLLLNRSNLAAFNKMVARFEKCGKPKTRIGVLRFLPLKRVAMGQIDKGDEPLLVYISNFEKIDRVEINDDGINEPEVTFYRRAT